MPALLTRLSGHLSTGPWVRRPAFSRASGHSGSTDPGSDALPPQLRRCGKARALRKLDERGATNLCIACPAVGNASDPQRGEAFPRLVPGFIGRLRGIKQGQRGCRHIMIGKIIVKQLLEARPYQRLKKELIRGNRLPTVIEIDPLPDSPAWTGCPVTPARGFEPGSDHLDTISCRSSELRAPSAPSESELSTLTRHVEFRSPPA